MIFTWLFFMHVEQRLHDMLKYDEMIELWDYVYYLILLELTSIYKRLLHNLSSFYLHALLFLSCMKNYLFAVFHIAMAWKFQEKCGFKWITFKAKHTTPMIALVLPSAQVEKS